MLGQLGGPWCHQLVQCVGGVGEAGAPFESCKCVRAIISSGQPTCHHQGTPGLLRRPGRMCCRLACLFKFWYWIVGHYFSVRVPRRVCMFVCAYVLCVSHV